MYIVLERDYHGLGMVPKRQALITSDFGDNYELFTPTIQY